jgi:hypothetical protein
MSGFENLKIHESMFEDLKGEIFQMDSFTDLSNCRAITYFL